MIWFGNAATGQSDGVTALFMGPIFDWITGTGAAPVAATMRLLPLVGVGQ